MSVELKPINGAAVVASDVKVDIPDGEKKPNTLR